MKFLVKSIVKYIKETDNILIFLCICVSTYSVLLLTGLDNSGLLVRKRQIFVQCGAAAVGLLCAVIMSKIDYKLMAKLWKLHSLLGYGLVFLTFVIGIQVGDFVDDRAWIELPIIGLTLQPSEFLKISFIVSFAFHLQKVGSHINELKSLIPLVLHGMLPVGLIMLQGDHGTALIFFFIFASMMFTAGLGWKYILTALTAAVMSFPALWYILSEDKKMRIMSILNPMLDPEGIGWQQNMGMLSIGSGQIWGKGLFAGKHHYVPEIYNDFIFAFIGEALGFVGCLSVIVLLGAMVLKILAISARSSDLLGKYICVGVFAMFAFQILLNIGMCISVLPVIGITLPFFSAGGTSVVASYLGIGLALSVYVHNDTRGIFGENL